MSSCTPNSSKKLGILSLIYMRVLNFLGELHDAPVLQFGELK